MFSSVILNIGMEWTNKLWLPATTSSLSYSWAGNVHSHLCTPQAEVCRMQKWWSPPAGYIIIVNWTTSRYQASLLWTRLVVQLYFKRPCRAL